MANHAPVLVVGGGPAGACAAALLARHGVPVIVLEKHLFPRHHVGESLQPATFDLLQQHLDLDFSTGSSLDAAAAQPSRTSENSLSIPFARKYGAVYVWGETREPWSVLFDERLERDLPHLDEDALLAGDYEHAWQVERSRFDHILLRRAAALGAEVREGWEALAPMLENDRVVGLRARRPDGRELELTARTVLDCSGQRCLVGRHFRLTRLVSDLQATATYAYYDGAGGVPGPLGRHVQLVVSLPEGWAWFIPVGPDRTSVGVVHQARTRLSPARFDELLDAADLPLNGAHRCNSDDGPLYFARDWSFTHRRFAGPGWMLVGDAACFVDPILSGGVDFAVRGAFNAALALLRVRDGGSEEALFSAYDDELRREYRAYLRLARYWYGNNRSVDGLFWEAHDSVPVGSVSTPMRAFVYLTSGRYAADRHLRVFQEWQEKKMFRALGVDRQALKATRDRS